MDFAKLSLAKKLTAGFGLLVILSTIGTSFAVFKSVQMVTSVKDLQKIHLPLGVCRG